MTPSLILTERSSPIGPLGLAFDTEGRLRGVSFGPGLDRAMARTYPGAARQAGAAPEATAQALDAYFDGEIAALSRIAWSLDGAAGAEGFNGRVWRELARVPGGTTLSYGEMARRAGEAGAAQAAGVALNRNPLALVLPCHRVIGADGGLVGFGGGLERKTWLLRHEGALLI
ncbi:MAG: methylated-DNA--[protein]-cysteine S-methyltransferase [Brevundimonas sp.]|uniref:methylated-DNA--[protein]-cysteine S-methyltransferase n=1 Tax=Brevundimonas sp. TaxID=1871086 RepID=UPI0025BB47F7|nr:methylated-DNA--[protein]-cysteine S-methyltransferase [Brevundimonas sp.]MBX3478369.1 methylated-DNA--[protein]-cysteine S-methyltransferase [Brevundimonas sp.]